MSAHRAALLGLVLLSPLPALAQAPAIEVTGAGARRELACTGQDVNIAGASHQVTLSGRCGAVVVTGLGHVVTLAEAAKLEVMGSSSRVTASGMLGEVAVYGRDHRIKGATTPADATAEMHGEGSLAELVVNGPLRVIITGINNRLLWTAAANVPDPVGDVGGQGSRLERAP